MELLKDIKRHSYAPEDPEYRRLLTRLRKRFKLFAKDVAFDWLSHVLISSDLQ